jgi:hypothetical protein
MRELAVRRRRPSRPVAVVCVGGRLEETIAHLRADIEKMDEPQFKGISGLFRCSRISTQ